jgi:hypothetical protein
MFRSVVAVTVGDLGVAVGVGAISSVGVAVIVAVGSTGFGVAVGVVGTLATLKNAWAAAPLSVARAKTVTKPWFSQPVSDGTTNPVVIRPIALAVLLDTA